LSRRKVHSHPFEIAPFFDVTPPEQRGIWSCYYHTTELYRCYACTDVEAHCSRIEGWRLPINLSENRICNAQKSPSNFCLISLSHHARSTLPIHTHHRALNTEHTHVCQARPRLKLREPGHRCKGCITFGVHCNSQLKKRNEE
jgi:hypothetical protein